MHWFLRHTDDYYYANYRSLQDRLSSAAAAAIHFCHWQQEHNSFSKALYMDMQCDLSGVFADIEFMHKHFPTRQYFICLRGNDRIETLFSIGYTARGTGGVLDILQLRHRLDVAAQLEELFALDPKWRLNGKRARYGDNMTPAMAGPCYVGDVDLCKAWVDGLARAERELGIAIEVKEGFGLFSPHGTIFEVDNKDLQEDDRIDSDEDDEDSDETFVEVADEAEQALHETSAIAYSGAVVGKQHVLNDLINNSFGKLGHDRLVAALSQPRPGHVLDVPTQAHCESMPIVGDHGVLATAMCYGTVISLAILRSIRTYVAYVRTVTDASGRQAMDNSYDVMESSKNLIIHGLLLPFEHCPGPDLHVPNGMLNPRVVQVRGEDCQFVTLDSNLENYPSGPN